MKDPHAQRELFLAPDLEGNEWRERREQNLSSMKEGISGIKSATPLITTYMCNIGKPTKTGRGDTSLLQYKSVISLSDMARNRLKGKF